MIIREQASEGKRTMMRARSSPSTIFCFQSQSTEKQAAVTACCAIKWVSQLHLASSSPRFPSFPLLSSSRLHRGLCHREEVHS